MSGAQLADLELRDDLFDDFCLHPFHPARAGGPAASTCSGGSAAAPAPTSSSTDRSALNLETYQASIAGRPLDLTYMEYELLKFLAQHPGKVFTREMLLSRVWGYEYYGGARTVDVHIRRLRAKLGEEHASLDPDRALAWATASARAAGAAEGPFAEASGGHGDAGHRRMGPELAEDAAPGRAEAADGP